MVSYSEKLLTTVGTKTGPLTVGPTIAAPMSATAAGKKVWSTKLFPDYHMYFRPGTPKWDPTTAFTNGRKISLYTICNRTVYCHSRWNWVRQHPRYFGWFRISVFKIIDLFSDALIHNFIGFTTIPHSWFFLFITHDTFLNHTTIAIVVNTTATNIGNVIILISFSIS